MQCSLQCFGVLCTLPEINTEPPERATMTGAISKRLHVRLHVGLLGLSDESSLVTHALNMGSKSGPCSQSRGTQYNQEQTDACHSWDCQEGYPDPISGLSIQDHGPAFQKGLHLPAPSRKDCRMDP